MTKRNGTSCRLASLVLLVFCVCVSQVHAQVVYGDTTDLKREVNDLRSQIQQLTTLVLQMRKAMLESATLPRPVKDEKEPAKPQEAVKEAAPVDEEHLTRIVCQAVSDFFSEADAVLGMSDPETARTALMKTLQKMTSKLHGYKGTHRVDKLLTIYEGLAWDTFTAVQLRESIEGNTAFLESLRQHKQKFLETCPRK
jgi:hypothetical protein